MIVDLDSERYPHYHLVPKDFDENIEFRKQVLLAASKDPEFAGALHRMCSEDMLFYVNLFCWTYDPRDTQAPKKPFLTYDFQDKAMDALFDAIENGYDVALPKSRTMGASWMGLTVFEWFWHFKDELTFLLVSRNEDYVDKKGNVKSLFWKIDFLHKNQPRWLLPRGRHLGSKDPNRTLLHLENAETGSTIDGESTTSDAARGDRRTAMFIDEFAAFEVSEGFKALDSTQQSAFCRIFNSTPQGAANAFYDVVHKTAARILRLHWTEHPVYNRGLYTSEKDSTGNYRLKLLDNFTGMVKVLRQGMQKPEYVIYPEQYPFILDGDYSIRSPWFDFECARSPSKQKIAQELNIDFIGSAYQFFDQDFIRKLIAEYCSKPMLRGRLLYDRDTLEPLGFQVDDKGPLHLWFNLRGDSGTLTDREYMDGRSFALGSDVSFGTGASNSATSVVDLATGRKVAVWRDPFTTPDKFAAETIALAKWFNNGFLIWDATGAPGRSFTKVIVERKYSKIYYRRNEERTRQRISDQPGYYMNAEDRAVLMREYRSKLQGRDYINVSEEGMLECLQFIVQPGGKVEHSRAANSQDPGGAREAHGDEAIADALVSRALILKKVEAEAKEPEIPYMSVAWRLREEEAALAAAEKDVDW